METNGLEKWRKVRRTLVLWLGVAMAAGGVFTYQMWGFPGLWAAEGAALCLALGFWLTEMLIGVFTRVKTANASAVVMLFTGKLAWWALLFWAAKRLPAGLDGAVASGLGIFLIALLISTLQHYGMPRISDGKPPLDP